MRRVDFQLPMGSAIASHKQLSDEERARIIKRARQELPERDKRFKEAMISLKRISQGLRPKA